MGACVLACACVWEGGACVRACVPACLHPSVCLSLCGGKKLPMCQQLLCEAQWVWERACVRTSVRVCVGRGCVRACVRACVPACIHLSVCPSVGGRSCQCVSSFCVRRSGCGCVHACVLACACVWEGGACVRACLPASICLFVPLWGGRSCQCVSSCCVMRGAHVFACLRLAYAHRQTHGKRGVWCTGTLWTNPGFMKTRAKWISAFRSVSSTCLR